MAGYFDDLLDTPAPKGSGLFDDLLDTPLPDAYPDQVSRAASRPQVTAPPLADTEDSVSRTPDARKAQTLPRKDVGVGELAKALGGLWAPVETVQDVSQAALKVPFAALSSVAEVANMATGDTVDWGVIQDLKRVRENITKTLGSDKLNQEQRELAKIAADDNKSVGDWFGYGLEHPTVLVDKSIETIGSMFLPGGIAKGVGTTLGVLGKSEQAIDWGVKAAVIATGAAQNAASVFDEMKGVDLQTRYEGAGIAAVISALVGIVTDGGAEAEVARRLTQEVRAGIPGALAAAKRYAANVLGTGVKEGVQEIGEESGNVAGEAYAGKEFTPTGVGKRLAESGVLGPISGAGTTAVTSAPDLARDISASRAERTAQQVADNAIQKAQDMFSGMVRATPAGPDSSAAANFEPTSYDGVGTTVPNQGTTSPYAAQQPTGIVDQTVQIDSGASPGPVDVSAPTEITSAATGPATQAESASSATASAIQIDANDPAASIAAIAAAPITQIGASSAPAADQETQAAAAGDIAPILGEIAAIRDTLKSAPAEARPALQARMTMLANQARAKLAQHAAAHGEQAATQVHTLAAQAAPSTIPYVTVPELGQTPVAEAPPAPVELPELDFPDIGGTVPATAAQPAADQSSDELPSISMPSAEEGVRQAAIEQSYPGSSEVRGIHFGTTPGLTTLSGEKYGTGASRSAGEESSRLQTADPRVRQRTYFYAHDGLTLPEPEGVVTGKHTYEARLPGVLDITSKPAQAIMKATPRDQFGRLDLNAFELAVVEAGYSGYRNGSQVVILGRDTPVKYLGTRFDVLQAERRAAAESAPKPEAKPAKRQAQPEPKPEPKRERILPHRAYQKLDPIVVQHPMVQLTTKAVLNDALIPNDGPPVDANGKEIQPTREFTPRERFVWAGITQGLLDAGIHPVVLGSITSAYVYTAEKGSDEDAHYLQIGTEAGFGIEAKCMLRLQANNVAAAEGVVSLFIHESWHHMDTYREKRGGKTVVTAMSLESPRTEIAVDGDTRVPVGDIMTEVVELFFGDPTNYTDKQADIVSMMSYPLNSWNKDIGTSDQEATTNTLREEVMAQLHALWYADRGAMTKHLPVAAVYFKGLDDAIQRLPEGATIEDIRQLVGAGLNVAKVGGGTQQSANQGRPAQGKRTARPDRLTPNRELTEKDLLTARDKLSPYEQGKLKRQSAVDEFVNTFLQMPSSKETAAIAWAGRAKKGWYRSSAYALHHVFGQDAPRFAVLLAALSPQTSVESNLQAALQTWVEWEKRGRPQEWSQIDEAMQIGARGTSVVVSTDRNNIIRALTHPDPAAMMLSGPKITSFFRNLIDNTQEVTNDSWMAAFAFVDAQIFGGTSTPISKLVVTNEGKTPGYLAMSAHVRQAADMLTKLTGETWTPAEVQETVWSWTKTLYELAGRKGTSEAKLNEGALTDALIQATPDFSTLLSSGEYADILKRGGFGENVRALEAANEANRGNEERSAELRSAGEKAPFAAGTQRTLEQRAARRLDQVREARRAAKAAAIEAEERKAASLLSATQSQAQGPGSAEIAAYDPDDPNNASAYDFRESPEEAIKKPGWFIITGTQEGKSAEANILSNEDLATELRKSGYDFQLVRGMWNGVDQGDSFLVFGPSAQGLQWAKRFNQEAIATARGFEYQDGRLDAADHDRDTFGAEARKQAGYTVLPNGLAMSMGFPPAPAKLAKGRASVTEGTEMKGDGRGFTEFFSEATKGNRAPDASVPYEPVLDITSVSDFSAEYVKHRGNFDDHIATSIPGFREVQQAVGAAIVSAYPNGATLLDIAASEGAFNKAITAQSNGAIETVALDPNLDMAKFFEEHSQVPGATYEVAAFGSAEDAGKVAWTEDDGTEIRTFDPKGEKFDVVHEAMGFQFISNTRNAQFARVKELMTPDGIAIFEEKVKEDTPEWKANEAKKDAYKARYFTQAQLEAKKAEVLEKGQAAADEAAAQREQSVVGMNDLMTTGPELETALSNNWQHVVQYWSSGNFKGYVASDDPAALQRFVDALPDLNSEYSTVSTPVPVEPMKLSRHRPGGPTQRSVFWETPADSRWDSVVHALQDQHIDTKRVVQSITEHRGPVSDTADPYLREELYHGVSAKATENFVARELRPLLNDMAMRKVTRDEFETYLWNRHAEERNKQIARINPKMPDGGSGIKTADARAYLASLSADRRNAYMALARRLDAITAGTNALLVSSGLESQATIDTWNRTYKHYVPLHREDMDDSRPGTGQGYSVKGPASRRALGSTLPVEHILANVAQARERAITRAAKNRVAIALVLLAQQNTNPNFWTVDKPRKIRYVGQNGMVVEAADPMQKNRNNVVVARIPDANGNVEEHFVTFNERDPRAMRMAESLKNIGASQLDAGWPLVAGFTRYFASINTQYNPIFGVVNLTRDIQSSAFNLTSTPIAGRQVAVLASIPQAMSAALRGARAMRSGRTLTGAWDQAYEEFQQAGGQTGFKDMFATSADRSAELEREIRRAGGTTLRTAPEAFIRWAGGWLSDYNTAMENATRLAAFKVARDNGVSQPRAASLAKNLTVNFNRKGAMGTKIGALWAFFNASMQGTARLAETMAGPRGRTILAGGLIAGVLQALALAAAGFDDDEPPEFVRERSFIIPIGGKKYLSIPMPLGLNVIPNLGRIPTELVLNGGRDKAEKLITLLWQSVNSFNPMGQSTIAQTLSPTFVDPIVALAENRDWTGKEISRPDMNPLDPAPGHSRAKSAAAPWSMWLSEAVNMATGGTEYTPGKISPTPEQISYLVGQFTGGVGREIDKVATSAKATVTGEDLPPHKIPLVGRFYGDASSQSGQAAEFYRNVVEINKHERELKGRAENDGDVDGYLAANPVAELVQEANKAESKLRKLRKQKRALLKEGAHKADVKDIEDEITDLMIEFNETVADAR